MKIPIVAFVFLIAIVSMLGCNNKQMVTVVPTQPPSSQLPSPSQELSNGIIEDTCYKYLFVWRDTSGHILESVPTGCQSPQVTWTRWVNQEWQDAWGGHGYVGVYDNPEGIHTLTQYLITTASCSECSDIAELPDWAK